MINLYMVPVFLVFIGLVGGACYIAMRAMISWDEES